MAFNGNGVFQRIYTWVTDAGNGVPMTPSRFDQDANDMAAGLSNCITRNGQSPPTTNLPMGGFKLTGLAAGTAAADSINYAQITTAGTGTGTDLTPFLQSGTGASPRSAQDKLRDTVSINDFKNGAGNAPGTGGDDTLSWTNAVNAVVRNGGFGTIEFLPGRVYNITGPITIDGVLGLTLKGKNGGNVGNLSAASSGGAATLNFTNATGDCLAFTGVAYHAAQFVFEDIAIFGNTTGYVLSFNNCSQINFNRVTVSNAGGTTATTGNGIRFSNCYYVYAQALYVWKQGTLYSAGQNIVIDKGALSSFLGGLYNFVNCSTYGALVGLSVGDSAPGSTGNVNYACVNWVNSEMNGNSQGAVILYGAKNVNFVGGYNEGNLAIGILVANQAASVNVNGTFFNNPTASVADIALGQNGSGTSYTQFYDVDVRNCHFAGVNKFGIQTASSGQGSSFNAEGNRFTLATALAVAISSIQTAVGNLRATARNNSFIGFPVGTSMAGYFTTQHDNYEYSSAGAFLGSWKQANLLLPAFVSFTTIQPNDPDTMTLTNTAVGARLVNSPPVSSKNRRTFVTLTAASTQSVGLYKSDASTLMATLTAGKGAWVWNDGTNEYASLLP